jgi:hypothetical protein
MERGCFVSVSLARFAKSSAKEGFLGVAMAQ